MAPSLIGVSALIVVVVVVVLLLLVFVLTCRPWRFFAHSYCPSPSPPINNADDLNRPLFSENVDDVPGQSYDLARNFVEESRIQIDENNTSPSARGFINKKRVHSTKSHISQDSLVLDVTNDPSEDPRVCYTLKNAAVASFEDLRHVRRDINNGVDTINDNGRNHMFSVKDIPFLRSSLDLEVIAGPSRGLCCSRQSTNTSKLSLTVGRVSPSDLLLKDSEVSGKHALIKWNMNTSKWELVDMGSLNGTFLNSQLVQHPDVGSRNWSDPVELADGDVITLGTSSKVFVQISQHVERQISIGVGIASEPMSIRRGGRRLPMEDVCSCQYPLPGVEQFGLFGIFDGHGGVGAAKAASKILPENIANILSNPERKERVLLSSDASDVLRDAFSLTEATMNHQYEGCTATILLIWFAQSKECFVQCANVGDSSCFVNVNGQQIMMTEDHRVTSMPERARLAKLGRPLKDGEARLSGLNISRMLGDKFLKEQDSRFSSEPYISQVVHITKACTAFALIASDGLWDVISIKKAVQLFLQGEV
ncbi:protein phosphatase 2C 70 isoform X2 [Ananas comosus]|uniref:protein-serine/threonine phosphatase n=1 Tax=Ananas comosus TaxID=4615 RepID=A0A6P5G0F4_ANACO|nr:protein phosphatase 2C 70 isoform X2 [Ananas comosus]